MVVKPSEMRISKWYFHHLKLWFNQELRMKLGIQLSNIRIWLNHGKMQFHHDRLGFNNQKMQFKRHK